MARIANGSLLKYLPEFVSTYQSRPNVFLAIENQPNPAYEPEIGEFDWIAKGDAFQGDIQVVTDPSASALYSIWEQELAIDEESSMSRFQGADVWYRKVKYPLPIMGNTDSNGIIDKTDIYG